MHPLVQLQQSFTAIMPAIAHIEEHVLAERLPHTVQMTDAQATYDREKAQLYFRLYTVPVLEYAGLLNPYHEAEAIRWGKIQLLMGLHIRYIDKVIDGDASTLHFHEVQLAHYYLLAAITLLGRCGHTWNHVAQAIYGQYLQYEAEVRAGHRHSYGSLWRRVSPLCVVPAEYVSSPDGAAPFVWFREYLSWSLLRADCDDALKDLHHGVATPVACLLREAWTNSYHDAFVAHDVLTRVMQFLEQKRQFLAMHIAPRYPLWSVCVNHIHRNHGDVVKVL